MQAIVPTRRGAALAVVLALFSTAVSHAQMIPVADERVVSAHAHYEGVSDGDTQRPAYFVSWNAQLGKTASTDNGFADAGAFQISEFFPAAIYASGGASGEWQGTSSGTYDALSYFHMRFRVNNCITYALDATVEPGFAPQGSTGVHRAEERRGRQPGVQARGIGARLPAGPAGAR